VISSNVFASDFDIKRFPDVAQKLGLDVEDLAGGIVIDDFDNNGNLDLLVSGWGINSELRFFLNNGQGFVERAEKAGLRGLVGALNMIQSDYNNDGNVDVLLLRGGWMATEGHYPMSLLKNHGNGTFTDVTEQAGLLRFKPSQTGVWLDFNNDGHLDLYVGNETWGADSNACELFQNNGNGTFTEIGALAGVAALGVVKGVTAADFNKDGRTDIFVSIREDSNLLFRNDGPVISNGKTNWIFKEVAKSAGVTGPHMSFPTWFFDYDNDGWEDLFVCGYHIKNVSEVAADYLGLPGKGVKPALYKNKRDGTFEDVTKKMGLEKVLHGMGSNFGDLDNDGWVDFYIGTGDPDLATLIPNRMFRNHQGERFQDVTTSGGFGHLQKGHGISFADLDNDGDQDVYAVMGGAVEGDVYRRVLFQNPGHSHRWIKLKLEGVKSNRSAIGARISLTLSEMGKTRVIYKTVNSGGSFGSNPLRQEIGLGTAQKIEKLEIHWPATGKTESFGNLSMNAAYRITEGKGAAEPILLQKVDWSKKFGEFQPHQHFSP
jgi:hypothetical protein